MPRPKLDPEIKKQPLTVRLSKWLIDGLLDEYSEESKGNMVEHALLKTYPKLKKYRPK